MRRVSVSVAAAVVSSAGLLAAPLGAAPPARTQSSEQQARRVLAQVSALDIEFGKVVEAWNGANIQLATSERDLRRNRVALARALARSRAADRRVAERLVSLYETERPSTLDVVVGATRLRDVIDLVDTANTVAAADHRLAVAAHRERERLAAVRGRLRAIEQTRRATVKALAEERARIGGMLAQRRRLLSSIRTEIAAAKEREARQQARLAAEARARLAREQAAAARRARAEAARRAAEAKAAQPPPSTSTSTTAATTTAPAAATAPPPAATTAGPPAPTDPQPTTADPQPATSTDAQPPSAPAASAPGHPEAATIALRYLGVPYVWGGATPAGFDCSGLVSYVFAQLGILLPHFAAAQYGYGVPVPRADLQPGDLVFFDQLSHVGIYIGNGQFVHAPQTGDVVKISELATYGGRYVGARRV